MRGALVDEPRFFNAGDHLNRKAQRRLGTDEKVFGVGGHSQGIGGHHPHAVGAKGSEPFGKPV
ncbi:MAG: hypothetical protein EBW84_09280 [Betaproteobacteria bacterium]|nr:hypothetical protein [Betaproteobacteria bacterium]